MKHNIFDHEKIPLSGEIFHVLLQRKNVVIEKILSSNMVPEKEYIQDHDEWVILLSGQANIFIDHKETTLAPGDYLFIESGKPHRVLKTAMGTTWLAIRLY